MLPKLEQYAVASSPLTLLSEDQCSRPVVRGKFLFRGSEKFFIRGVTYGTFRPDNSGVHFPPRETVRHDFSVMAANGINAVRVYTIPALWVLDEAADQGLDVMVGLPWEQHIAFLDEPARVGSICRRVRAGVRHCNQHPAVLGYAIGNEIPADIVSWYGPERVRRFLRMLFEEAKSEDPSALITYVNFPTTEYLQLDFLDFVSFNVYLEAQEALATYLARLHNLAGDRPLIMAEVGLDSCRHGEIKQAEVLDWQIRTSFASGCAGIFLFAWTDEWYRGGFDIEGWDFGLVTRNRRPKLALSSVRKALAEVPFSQDLAWPRASVIICSYNGARTLRETLEHVACLDYPDYEVIVVNDGSTDRTLEIAGEFNVRLITTANGGLSQARNVGLLAASGEIVAFCDDDAYPDPHWLRYLAYSYLTGNYAGVGGPNLPPPGDGPIAEAVANAPGGPIHVLLSDTEAEHIPGCNSSFRREALLAINGYDSRFRAAGDDVDVCWRLQAKGWRIGFHPAAVVWHHRRNSIRAYWQQQRGYGRAEALLDGKWPEKYNELGHLTWAGRVYSASLTGYFSLRSRIYHGTWNTAPFQRLYEPTPGRLASLCQMPEWYLVTMAWASLFLLGFAWKPLLWAGVPLCIAVTLPLTQVAFGVVRSRFPSQPRSLGMRSKLYILTAVLFLLQPIARLYGRMVSGLAPWHLRGGSICCFPLPVYLQIWSEKWRTRVAWLSELEDALLSQGIRVRRGGDFDNWDLEISAGAFGGVRAKMAIEEHGAGKQLIHFRLCPFVWQLAIAIASVLPVLLSWALRDRALLASVFLLLALSACAIWIIRCAGHSLDAASAAVRKLEGQE